MNNIRLGVNIDHIATLRQVRQSVYPDPVRAALLAVQGGADSITVHLREDRRHIQERDVFLLMEIVQVPLNLEIAPTPEMIELACKLRPDYCCLVPERREELTTEGGLDVIKNMKPIQTACKKLHEAGINVSLFVDPIKKQINAALDCNATTIELHTGAYSNAENPNQHKKALMQIAEAAAIGEELGLFVNAGHGLNYQNVNAIAEILFIDELNIGHSIVAEAAMIGMEQAVRRMKNLIENARQNSKLEYISVVSSLEEEDFETIRH